MSVAAAVGSNWAASSQTRALVYRDVLKWRPLPVISIGSRSFSHASRLRGEIRGQNRYLVYRNNWEPGNHALKIMDLRDQKTAP
jgi:hypothetical protein